MITIMEALRDHLLADASIAALVSARVWPRPLPQPKTGVPTYPAVQITQVSGERYGHLHGPASLARPRYQLDCWDQTFQGAARLGNLCRQRLDRFVGNWSDAQSPPTTVFVQIEFQNERNMTEEDQGAIVYRHLAEYLIFHGTAGGTI